MACFSPTTYPMYKDKVNIITMNKYKDIFTDDFVKDALTSNLPQYVENNGVTNPEEIAVKSIILKYMSDKIADKNDGIKRYYANKANVINEVVHCQPYHGNYNRVINTINSDYREENIVSEGQPAKQPENGKIVEQQKVEVYDGFWTREEVSKQTDKVFLFGDNTDDRLNTNYVPTSTQAVIRGLDNAIGIDTKHDRGTKEGGYGFVDIPKDAKKVNINGEDIYYTVEKPKDVYDLKLKISFYKKEKEKTFVLSKDYRTFEDLFKNGKEEDKITSYVNQLLDKKATWTEYKQIQKGSYLSDDDFGWFKSQVDNAIQKAIDSGKTIVIPKDGIGTGKAMLKEKAPKCFKYLQDKLNSLYSSSQTQTPIQQNKSKAVEVHNNLVSDLGGGDEAKSEIKDAVKVAKQGVSFEEALKGQESIFTSEEQAQIKKALNGKNLKVMSVSRKTDPAFFSNEIVKFLEENSKKPFTDPTRVNAVEIWSKHDGMPIQDILDACKKYKVAPMMSFSITGLGGTSLEKGVMKYNDLLDRIEKLVKSGSLNPLTTTVRIDPILVGVTNIDDIRNIVNRAKKIGIKKFVTSLVQSYGYTEGTPNDRKVISGINNALAKDGKTYDWDEYYGRNIDGKINFKPKKKYINEIGKVLKELNEDPSITIQSCAFGIAGLKTSACLDPLIIERLTGLDIMSKDGKYDRDTSRPECMCYGAHGDFFAGKNKKCYSSCAYCYAAHSGDNSLDYYDENGNLKVGDKIDYYTNVRTNDSKSQQQGSNTQPQHLNIIPTKSVDNKAKAKGSISNKFIGYADGIAGSSTAEYAKQAGDKANVGVYSSNDTIFVSVPGKRGEEKLRKEQQDKTIKEAIKALEAGATIITDSADYVSKSDYNEGERRLAENLKYFGYQYSDRNVNGTIVGQWNKTTNTQQPQSPAQQHIEKKTNMTVKGVDFVTTTSTDYPSRTRANANWSDITLHLATDFDTAGEKLTQRSAGEKLISGNLNDSVKDIVDGLLKQINDKNLPKNNIDLNVAGNGIYTLKDKFTQYELNDLVTTIISELQKNGISISEIRSSGQTGIDEAGVMAGKMLGIKSSVLTTSDWKFRNSDNKDISDEKLFKERFGTIEYSFSEAQQDEKEDNTKYNTISVDKINNTTIYTNYQATDGLFPRQEKLTKDNLANCEAVVLFSNSQNEKNAHITAINKLNESRTSDKKIVLVINPSSDEIKRVVYNYSNIGMVEGRGGKGHSLDPLYNNVSIELSKNNKINNAEFIENSDMILYQRKIQHFYNQATKIARERHADFFIESEEGEKEIMRAVYNAINRELNETDDKFRKEKLSALVNNWDHVLSVINIEEVEPDMDEENPDSEDPLYMEQHTTSNMPKDKILRGLLASFPTGKVDELGTPIYYDSMVINNILVNNLSGAKDSDEMMDRLTKGMRKNPFFETIVKNIEADKSGRLRSMLFTKYANLYKSEYFTVSANRVIDETSTFSTTSINLGIVSNVDEERFVFSDKYRAEKMNLNEIGSLFANAGDIDDIKRTEPAKYQKWRAKGYSDEQILSEKGLVPFYSQSNLDKMTEFLKTVGIELDKDEHDLNRLEKDELIKLRNLVYNIHEFRGKIKDGDFDVNEWKKRNSGKTGWYSQILDTLNKISQQKSESMVKARGESKFLFSDKTYIDGMMDGLHKDRDNYMMNEFLKYEYFTSNVSEDYTELASGLYSSLLRKLALDKDTDWFRMIPFFIDKTDGNNPKQYKDLTPEELKGINQKLFWREEFSNAQRRNNGEDELCYVHAPIYADSGSLHYYCVPKIDINSKRVKNGDRDVYTKPDIIKEIENLILLETNRIAQCKKRAELIKDGKLKPVAVYDTVGDRKGNGEKYVFIPLLNDLDSYELIKGAGSQIERDKLIREFASKILSEVLKSDASIVNSASINHITPNDNEKYYLNKSIVESASESDLSIILTSIETDDEQKTILRDIIYNEPTYIGNIEKAIKLGDWEMYQNLIGKLYGMELEQNDDTSDEDEEQEYMEDEEELSDDENQEFKPTLGHEVQRVLTSYIRTADIEQLTITDPALYINDVDKQKRYKQVQAGYNRPDTKSKYGKEWMSSIILKDNEISLSEGELKVMRNYITERAKKDGINLNVDEIISVFKKINVADAQAWRTLKSYRSVRDMYGQWTQKDENLYQKIIHEEKLTKDDYDVVWQTLKPFVYTQHDTEWTTTEHDDSLGKDIKVIHYTKVGDQYKESEGNMYNAYLLMSIINSGESFETEVEEVYEDSYFETKTGGMVNTSILDTELEAFDIDVKTSNILNNYGIETLGDLIANNSKLFKLGKGVYNRLNSLVESLEIKGLSLGTNIEEFKKNSTKKEQKTTSVKKIADRVLTKLGQINKFMNDYDIDTVMFQSAVKVGQQGVIDLNKIDDNDIYSYLENATGVKGNKANKSGKISDPEVVHEIPYTEWGIKMSTPPHMYDTKQQLGSQLKKLVPGDIPEEAKIRIDLGVFNLKGKNEIQLTETESIKVEDDPEIGTYLNKENFLKLYHALMSDMIMDNYKGVQDVFGSKEALSNALQELMGSSPKYDYDIKQALLIKKGDFVIDPRNPLIKDKVVALMSSILKNRINKQMTRGGTAIQMTVWGGKDLNIEKNPDGSIKYMECYMPAYSKSFVEAYINENGILDVNKCKDDNLLRALCYRVPTEDMYSMIPLKIKGFMPMQFGTNIALPKEITALTGSDFDVDKMYMYLPEMRMETEFKKDRKEALKEFKKSDEYLIVTKYEINEAIKREIKNREENGKKPLETETTIDGTVINKLPEEDEDKIRKDIFNKNFMAYSIEKGHAKPMPKYIKFDSTKPVSENSYKQKANLLLSLMMNCISSPHNITKAQNPGGFEYLKKLADEINPEVNQPMSLTENQYLNFFNLNMTGKQLIGIYANNNVAHSLCQGTGLQLSNPVYINGDKYQDLGRITDTDGHRISRNIAEFLAASVDNAKDPVLGKLWQNKYTASTTCFLLRLGVPTKTIVKMFKELKDKYQDDFAKFITLGPGAFKTKASEFNRNMSLNSEVIGGYNFKTKETVMTSNFFPFVGAYAQTISNMETLNGLLKCDSTNGAMYDIADIADKQIKLNKLRNDPMLSGLQNVLPDYKEDENILSKSKEEIMKDLQEYHNHNDGTNKIVKSYQVAYYLTYVNYKRYYNEIIDPKMMNEIVSLGTQLDRFGVNEIKEFITEYTKQQLKHLEEFKPELQLQGNGKFKVVSTNEKIKNIIKETPDKLEMLKKRYPDNMFIKMLSRFDTKNGSYLIMRKISEMRAETVNEVKSDFNKLYSRGFRASNDAKMLINYALAINGFGYSPLSFISMIPLKTLGKINGIENMYDYFEIDNIEEFEDKFVIDHKLGEKVTYDKQKLLDNDGNLFEYPSTNRILTYTNFKTGNVYNYKKVKEQDNGNSLYMVVGGSGVSKDLYDIIDENITTPDIMDIVDDPSILSEQQLEDKKAELAENRKNFIESIVDDVVKIYNKEGLDINDATKESIVELMSDQSKLGRYYSLNTNPLDNYSPIAIDWCK